MRWKKEFKLDESPDAERGERDESGLEKTLEKGADFPA